MNDFVLIKVDGTNRPGIVRAITQLLSPISVEVLDIAQSVKQERFSLILVLELLKNTNASSIIKNLSTVTDELQLTVSVTSWTEEKFHDWAPDDRQAKYRVTLLSRCLTAHQLSQVASVAARFGLDISCIKRLTELKKFTASQNHPITCIEFALQNETTDISESQRGLNTLVEDEMLALRRAFLDIADTDIAVQEDTDVRRNRRLVVFDMDSTLIQTEVIDELAALVGCSAEVSAITERAMAGELDFKQSLSKRVAMLKGLVLADASHIETTLPLSDGAERLISTLSRFAYKTAIVSGGFQNFAEPLARRLGIDFVHANQLEVESGILTGRVTGVVVDAARKAEVLQQLAEQENLSLDQVVAVGDGANDLDMLGTAGLGVAFHAKPKVREQADVALDNAGLDAILYLLGFTDSDINDSKHAQ